MKKTQNFFKDWMNMDWKVKPKLLNNKFPQLKGGKDVSVANKTV